VIDSCWSRSESDAGEYSVYALAEKDKKGYVIHLRVSLDEYKKDPFKGELSLAVKELERWEITKNYSRSAKIVASSGSFYVVTAEVARGNEMNSLYVTNYGTKFHREGCRYLRQSQNTLESQAKENFTACSICKPDSPTVHVTNQYILSLNVKHEIKWAKLETESLLVVGYNISITVINLEGADKLICSSKKPQRPALKPHSEGHQGDKTDKMNVENLSKEEILNLRKIMQTESCASIARSHLGRTVLSSHPKEGQGKYSSKHYFTIQGGKSQAKNEFSLDFPNSVSILQVKLDLHLTHNAKQKEFDALIGSEKIKEFLKRNPSGATKAKTRSPQDSFKKSGESGSKLGLPVFSLLESNNDSGTTQTISSQGYLPIRVHNHKGASYNNGFYSSMLVSPSNNIFVTNYPHSNSHFIFTHLHGKSMIVDSITITSLFGTSNGGYPIGSGLLFTSDHLSSFYKSESFHTMTTAEYKKWLQTRNVVNPWEPVGCFEFDEKAETLHVELDYKREARYLFLKPTSMRSKPNNYTNNEKNSPIEIKFIGVKGTVVHERVSENGEEVDIEEEAVDPQDNSLMEKLAKLIDVDVIRADGSRLQLNEWKAPGNRSGSVKILLNDDLPVAGRLPGLPVTARVQFRITDNSLGFESLSGLNIRLENAPLETDVQWTLNGLSAQVFVPANNISGEAATGNKQPLRKLLLDVNEYPKFTQSLVKELTREKAGLERRKACGKLLSYLLGVRPELVHRVFNDLDLLEYVRLNVLPERNSAFLEVFSFLKHFDALEDFAGSLLHVL
jgi:hypothetical protein